MTTHELKTWPVYFERLLSGEKTFEIRKDDRGFQAGDELVLQEFDPELCQHMVTTCGPECPGYSGRGLVFRVGFVYRHAPGWVDCGIYVVLSLLPHDDSDKLPDWEQELIEHEAEHERAAETLAGLRAAVRHWRDVRGISLRQLAAELGTSSYSMLSRFENGGDVQLSTALKLVNWLAGRSSGGDRA
jgi:hypothetical protein